MAACLLAGALLAGCASSSNEAVKALNPDPPAKMYGYAEGLMNNGSYTDAAKKFEALADGGKVTMPFGDTFWGAKFGMLTDRFGIPWMFNCEIRRAA